jgi:hypothetical protein
MINQVVMLMTVGLLGLIGFQVIRNIATSWCVDATVVNSDPDLPPETIAVASGWGTVEILLICEIVGIVLALAVIILLFVLIAKSSQGLT